jgi:hypothetical protein
LAIAGIMQQQMGMPSLGIPTERTNDGTNFILGGFLDDRASAKIQAFGQTGQLFHGERASAFRVNANPQLSKSCRFM